MSSATRERKRVRRFENSPHTLNRRFVKALDQHERLTKGWLFPRQWPEYSLPHHMRKQAVLIHKGRKP
jgi:hypothetical protein